VLCYASNAYIVPSQSLCYWRPDSVIKIHHTLDFDSRKEIVGKIYFKGLWSRFDRLSRQPGACLHDVPALCADQALFDKAWTLPDVEKVAAS